MTTGTKPSTTFVRAGNGVLEQQVEAHDSGAVTRSAAGMYVAPTTCERG
jgi:hypothetical protein